MNLTSKSRVFVLAVVLSVVPLATGSVAGASGGSPTSSASAKHAPVKLGLPAATPIRALRGRVVPLDLKGMPLIILPEPALHARYVVTTAPAGVAALVTVRSGTEQAPAIAALKVGRTDVTLHTTGGGPLIKFMVVVTSRALTPVASGPSFRSLSSLNGRVQHLGVLKNNGILLQALPGGARYQLRATNGGVVALAATKVSGRVEPLLVARRVGITSVTLTNPVTKRHATFTVDVQN